MYSKVLKNARVFLNGKFEELNVGIQGSRIAELSSSSLIGKEEVSCKGLSVFPGFIDSQVHFREPGLTHKEDICHGSKAAAAGGITAFFEMPNTKPATTTSFRLQEKLDIAKKTSYTDYAFFAGATKENIEDLDSLRKIPGVCGVKIFMGSSTGDLLLSHDEEIYQALAKARCPIAIHSEDEDMLVARKQAMGSLNHVMQHPVWRNEEVALSSTKRVLSIAKKLGRKVHLLHITTAEEIEYLSRFKNYCTFEVTPQHLSFCAPNAYETRGSLAQMNPPIRSKRHQDALWRGIAHADLLGSDHAPHLLSEKSRPYPESPSGMPGVETIAPVMLTHALEGKLPMEKLVSMLCTRVCEIYGISDRGTISPNMRADFSIFDLQANYKIDETKLHSKCGWSLFDGFASKAKPVMTMVGGDFVFRDNKLIKTERSPVMFQHNYR